MNSFTDLVPGQKIRVIKSFKDFDNDEIKEGTILTYVKYEYFPYDGGYILSFKEFGIRLAEISAEDSYILTHPLEFIELLEDKE